MAAEFVGTSITSGGDGADQRADTERIRSRNPHVRFFNDQRGYVRCHVTPERWRTDFRVLPYVSRRGGRVSTRASVRRRVRPAPAFRPQGRRGPPRAQATSSEVEGDRARAQSSRRPLATPPQGVPIRAAGYTTAMLRDGPVPRAVHGAIEYVAAIAFIVVPLVLAYESGAAVATSIVVGIVILIIAASTEGPTSLVNQIPIAAHVVLDYLLAIFLIAAPFLFGFSNESAPLIFFIALGVTHLLLTIATRFLPEAEKEGGRRRSTDPAPTGGRGELARGRVGRTRRLGGGPPRSRAERAARPAPAGSRRRADLASGSS